MSGEKKLIIKKKRKGGYSVLEGNHRAVWILLSDLEFKSLSVYLGIEKIYV